MRANLVWGTFLATCLLLLAAVMAAGTVGVVLAVLAAGIFAVGVWTWSREARPG